MPRQRDPGGRWETSIGLAQESELARRVSRRVLGPTLFEKFLDNKRMEWETYRAQVHEYELNRYLSIL